MLGQFQEQFSEMLMMKKRDRGEEFEDETETEDRPAFDVYDFIK
jgi:hypothetical protein